MESENIILLTGIASMFGGIVIGVILALWWSPSKQKNRDLEKHLNTQQQELKSYRHEVTEHFSKTAELLGDLAHSYRDVHNHLATGAQALCRDDFDPTPILNTLPKIGESSDETADANLSNVSPPLDYAPKATPYEQGTLNEEYGLEKVKREEPIETPPELTEEVAVDKPEATVS